MVNSGSLNRFGQGYEFRPVIYHSFLALFTEPPESRLYLQADMNILMVAYYLRGKSGSLVQFDYGEDVGGMHGKILGGSVYDGISQYFSRTPELEWNNFTVPPAPGAHVPGGIEIFTAFFTFCSYEIVQVLQFSPESWN